MNEEEHFSILSWQKVYKSIDNIWMYCLSYYRQQGIQECDMLAAA
jgi:hypothetical protein